MSVYETGIRQNKIKKGSEVSLPFYCQYIFLLGPVTRHPMFMVITRSIMTRYIPAAISMCAHDAGAESDHNNRNDQNEFCYCFHG
jgi:hypothetical protein